LWVSAGRDDDDGAAAAAGAEAMSRLGKKPVSLGKASASLSGRTLTVSSGDKTLTMDHRPEVTVSIDDESKTVEVALADGFDPKVKQNRAYWGTTRSLIKNMVEGVTEGYVKKLDVVGVGYTAQIAGQKLDLKVGFANTVSVPIPPGLDVSVEQQTITVKGIDKQQVGHFAAKVHAVRKPEPYNGKGIMYQGEQIIRKQGKAFGS
jgi:large subunit ribosomal protein L6